MALRHPVFEGPFPVALDRVTLPTPPSYAHYHQDAPLGDALAGWKVHDVVRDAEGRQVFGSVAVGSGFDDTPDAEAISSGVNTKGPYWVAIGRHGNYLMWGFAAAPDAMTPSGKAVFCNSVAYISGFDGQPPTSLRRFVGRDWWLDQAVQFRDLRKEYQRLKDIEKDRGSPLPASFGVSSFETFTERTATRSFPDLWDRLGADLDAYYPAMLEARDYLFAAGREFAAPHIDADARTYGIPNHSPALLAHCIALLEKGEDSERARRVLARYTGLRLADAKAWREWFEAARDGLYFSDTAGYRFFSTNATRFEREQLAASVPVQDATPDAPVQLAGALLMDPESTTRGTLVVRVQTAPGWHLYAAAGADSPYEVTRMTVDARPGVRTVGAWRMPKSHPHGDDPTLMLWEGDLVFRQRVEADPGKALPRVLTVRVAYQTCDANRCLPPREVEVGCAAQER